MNTNTLLHTNREEVRKAVLEKLGKTEQDVQKDMQLIKNWLHYQKHLPEIPSDTILEIFLIVNKFNLEKCKKKLDNYYKIRTEIPELYVDKNPKLEHMMDMAKTVYIIPLPKLTPSLSRVTVMKLKDVDPEKFNPINYFAHSYNVLEIRIREDMVLTDTLVYDMEGLQLGHIFKLRIGVLRKAAAVLEKVFSSRVEGIHYINLPGSMQVLVNLMKTMLGEKIRKRIHVHKGLEGLHKHLPKELLPQDYGGYDTALTELHGLWLEKFREYQEVFDHLEKFAPSNDDFIAKNACNNEDEESILSGSSDFKNLSVD